MATLLLLPPEITDQILALLTPHASCALRLLSRSYNARFLGPLRSTIFTQLRINTHPSTISHLSAIVCVENGAGPWIQHITFSSRSFSKLNPKRPISSNPWLTGYEEHIPAYNFHDGEGVNAPPSISININEEFVNILRHLPNLRFVEFDSTCGVAHWKELIASISKCGISAIEHLRSPPAKMYLSDLYLSQSEIDGYNNSGFEKLKTLELHTAGTDMKNLWCWISTVGSNLEDLTIRNSSSPASMAPGSPGFLPTTFNLRHLKRIHLSDFLLTVADILTLLLPSSQSLQNLHLVKCKIKQPQPENWFTVLKTLKDHPFPSIKSLHLTLSGYHDGISSYDLPDLKLDSSSPWSSPSTKCEVKLRSGEWNYYVVRKNLYEELNRSPLTAEEFWDSLTNGRWVSKRATRYKRIIKAREDSRAEYGYGDPGLRGRIRAINGEVDSECEDVRY
ncbi:hypothetical protein TWF481_000351 [Arthrobotrys musiformis]|uniref:F-box domain-containing protein n=1 Tax=Arthrobotrys musiformis TaxID=47236 RepID=A0AAV9WNG1_9PEZI